MKFERSKLYQPKRGETLSEKEAKLVKFCEENGIKFNVAKTYSKRGLHQYKFDFEPEFIDGVEKAVTKHCEENNISYRLIVDNEGFHHYDFGELIEIRDENVSNYCPALRNNNKKETYRKEIENIEGYEKEIKALKDSIDTSKIDLKSAEPKDWKEWIKYYLLPGFHAEVKNKREQLQQQLHEIESNKPFVLNRIKELEAERKLAKDMLVMAGIIE